MHLNTFYAKIDFFSFFFIVKQKRAKFNPHSFLSLEAYLFLDEPEYYYEYVYVDENGIPLPE